MKNKNYLYFALIFLVLIISVSAASAAEDAASDIISADNNDELILEDIINEDFSAIDDEELVLDENNANAVGDSNDEKLSEEKGSFADLNTAINGNEDETVKLNRSYIYTDTDTAFTNGIEINRKVTIDGDGNTIDGNNLARIFTINSANVLLQNINFINGKNDEGGAIKWIGDRGTLLNCNFENNNATRGGAIKWQGENGGMSDCKFTNNKVTESGGAIFGDGAKSAIFCDSIFENNSAANGGAITWQAEDLLITDCNFINNNATNYGGAMLLANNNHYITNSNFTGNTAKNGGAINWQSSTNSAIYNCNFINNNATDRDGGAVACAYLTDCNISHSNFENNSAIGSMSSGGAVSIGSVEAYITINTNCTVSNCKFVNNYAKMNGGAIELYNSDNPSISKCTFIRNNAENDGGAIYCDQGISDHVGNLNATISDCTYINNNGRYGGAICTYAANINVLSSIFENNTSQDKASTIYCFDAGNSKINNNIFYYPDQSAIIMTDGENANADCNWFGNTADDYKTKPTSCEYITSWLFLNATANPNPIPLLGTSNIVFKLDIYNESSGEISEYDNALLKTIDLVVSSKKGTLDKDIVNLGEMITYSPTELGKDTITATVQNVKSSIEANIVLKENIQIIAPNLTTIYNANDNLIITLKDNEGNPLSDKMVFVDLNGIRLYKTDSNGQIKISSKGLDAGTHTANILFMGDDNFSQASSFAEITVERDSVKLSANKVSTTYNVNKNLVISLKDSQGKAVSGAIITVKIGSITKKYVTDSNGQVKINVANLVPKTYTAKIKFDGNNNYIESSASAKVVVKKAKPKLTAKKKAFKRKVKVKKYSVVLKTNKNKALKKVKLTLKVKGKTYKATTNNKGKAIFKIKNLKKKGKYKAAVKFAGNKYYKKLSKKAIITVKK